MKHRPPPYRVEKSEFGDYWTVIDNTLTTVAAVHNKKDAKFIVAACNTHEGLVELAETLEKYFRHRSINSSVGDMYILARGILEALAKAEDG